MSEAPSAWRTAYLALSLLGVSVGFLVLRARAPVALERLFRFVESKRFWVPASVAVLGVFGGLLLVNAAYPGYLDRAEPTIASVSWIVMKGAPLYHALDSTARYSLLYGPASYLPYVGALWLGGGTALSLKCVLIVANAVTLYFLWRLFRTLFDGATALLVTTFVLLFLLVPRPNHYLFQVRGDVWIVCATVVGLFAASSPSQLAGPVGVALAAAFLIDTKASGFLYAIPLLARFAGLRGWRASSVVILCALGAAVLPFLIPNVSASLYLQWIHRGAKHPRSFRDLLPTIKTLPILVLPLLLILGPAPWRSGAIASYLRENRLRLLALGLSIAGAVVTSSRMGAGAHHVLPFVPVLAYEYALLYRAIGADFAKQRPVLFRYLWGCTAVVVVLRSVGGLAEILSPWSEWGWASAVTADLHAILRHDPRRTVEMGYGETEDQLTFFRPELVFATNRLTVDAQALGDMDVDGVPLPEATVDAVATCATDAWLIPKGKKPFTVLNLFGETNPEFSHPLFSAEFRQAFARHYRKDGSTPYFDLWVCDKTPPVASGRGRD